MKFKNIMLSFIASFCALLIPFSSAFADSAGWQLKTQELVHYDTNLSQYITGVDNAHITANVLICLRANGGEPAYFRVKEYDPGSNQDDFVNGQTMYQLNPTSNTNSTNCLQLNVSNYVDGDNNAAEIYVQTANSNAKFAIYD